MNGRAGPWGPCVGPRSDTCGPCGIHADRRQAVERRGHRGPEAVRDPADDVSGFLHATCRKPLTVFRFATLISHVHSDSESRVNRLPGSAHGTIVTTAPHRGRSTRGMLFCFNVCSTGSAVFFRSVG